MKRLPTKKLTLNEKTVRTLTDAHLRAVVGGVKNDDPHHVPSNPPETCSGSAAAGSAGCGGTGGGTGTGK
jgi:hypothetical protein